MARSLQDSARLRWVFATAVAGPMALSAALLLVAGLLPLRFDPRTFQDLGCPMAATSWA